MEIPNILPIQQAGQLVGLLSEDILDFVQEAFRLHTNGYAPPPTSGLPTPLKTYSFTFHADPRP